MNYKKWNVYYVEFKSIYYITPLKRKILEELINIKLETSQIIYAGDLLNIVSFIRLYKKPVYIIPDWIVPCQ